MGQGMRAPWRTGNDQEKRCSEIDHWGRGYFLSKMHSENLKGACVKSCGDKTVGKVRL